ncbi:MAG: type VI secretion system tip protein VgrG, partial [Holosporaceae bacterium]|nr:type VI secretion system tip protein VgrG [Holosporaceae bacterium]
KDSAIDLEKALGSNISITLKSETQERYINGIVTEFSQGSTENESDTYVTEYSATIRPCLWLLTLDRNNLIFQNKTAIDIINQVLKDQGIKDIEDKTKTCGKVKREYCVQYAESSFNFVSRLMEDEGIFYFFDHSQDKHTLVLADDANVYKKLSGESKVGFLKGANDVFPLGKVFSTHMTTALNTGGYSLSDYNYTISQTNLSSKLDTKWKGQMFYEYPGGFEKLKEGEDLSKLRVQLFEFNHLLFSAFSTAANLTPGFLFEVTDHHLDKFNKEYVIYDIEHSYDFSSSRGYIYKNRFRAFEKEVVFRPPRKTPKPRIHGTQTAVVTCPSGEEIFKNEHGCVKVHFHWDQIGKKDENDSCWIRVAQVLAGNSWGGIFIPRVGQEVVVTFIEGDPDRPLIVGCVYNDQYMPAYSDKEPMKSSFKTVTYTDDSGFNEIRFNDEKDKEEIYVHAQKDVYVDIINSRKTEIEESDDTLDLFKGSRSVTLQSKDGPANHSLSIKEGDSTITLDKGNMIHSNVNGDYTVTLEKGNMTYDITGDYTLTVSGDLTIKAGGKISFKADKDVAVESGTAMSLKSNASLDASAKSIGLKADMTLEANGQISTKLAGTAVEISGTATVKVSAPMITIGGGMLQLG